MADPLTSRERAEQLELMVCGLINGRRTPGSGSGSRKGDVESENYLAECKYRSCWHLEEAFIHVEVEWLETIVTHARRRGKIPLLVVETANQTTAVFLPLADYLALGEEELVNCGACPLRYLEINDEIAEMLPLRVHFEKIEVAETEWVILSWQRMLELRRTNERQPERKPTTLSGSSFKSRPVRWSKPAPWRQRPFR